MNTNTNLFHSVVISVVTVTTFACGGPDESESHLTVTQNVERVREFVRDTRQNASCSKSSIESQISELFPSNVPSEEELIQLRRELTDFRELLAGMREEIRVSGSVYDVNGQVTRDWTDDHISQLIASTEDLINNVDDFLDFIWSIAVVDGMSWDNLVRNITWEYSQDDLGNPGYTGADFFNDLIDLIDPNGPERIARIANWIQEKDCKCDKDGDGFIGRPNGRDKNKNGKCDEDEDCDGDKKPGYCADCGWASISTPPLSYEGLLFEFDVTGFIHLIGDMNFVIDVMRNELSNGAYGSCLSP